MTKADPMTPTMRAAVKSLREHGGEGAIDKLGRILAAGEVLGNGPHEAYSSVTWLRLMTLGTIVPAGPLRIKLAER